MANGNQDILQLIGSLIARGGAEFGKQQTSAARGAIAGGGAAAGGIAALGKILGILSTQKIGEPGGQQRIGKEIEQQLNPMQENVLKSVQKVHKEQVEKAMAQGASGEQILKDAGISISGEQPTDEEGKPDGTALALAGQQPPELLGKPTKVTDAGKQLLSLIGIDPSQGLIRQPSVSPEGVATPGSVLFGLLGETAESQLQRQQAQAAGPQGVQQEYDLKLRNALLTTDNPTTAGINVISSDIDNLIEARANVSLRGRLGGVIGAGGGFLGFQRGERAAFESFGTQLAFSYGEHIIGQKGRAFTDNERKEIAKKVTAASLLKNDEEFIGKMNAIIKQANSRVPQGGAKIPVITESKVGNIRRGFGQTQPGVQSEIDAINKRLEELGGQ